MEELPENLCDGNSPKEFGSIQAEKRDYRKLARAIWLYSCQCADLTSGRYTADGCEQRG
jgi:hypothetical protein